MSFKDSPSGGTVSKSFPGLHQLFFFIPRTNSIRGSMSSIAVRVFKSGGSGRDMNFIFSY